VRSQANIDPAWWASGLIDSRAMRDVLRAHDIGAVFRFLGGRGWSRAAIAAATGLTESRVRAVAKGTQVISSYDVLLRIADGLKIDRGLMGLAFTEEPAPSTLVVTEDSEDTRRRICHPADGKAMALVDESVFLHGTDKRMAWLPSFYIDLTLVTNAEYSVFIAATGWRPPSHWTDITCPVDLADHPVVNVTHGDASAYTSWAGKALPSELEWEKAARGPKGNKYPWGDRQTPAKCNVLETGVGKTTPVGLYRSGVSPYGVYDMAGNVWEWCATETAPSRYVLKGSAFTSPLDAAAAAATNDASATMSDDDTGFRCVWPVTEEGNGV
jgi:transcriptional regulator with XRE-family HTH domain